MAMISTGIVGFFFLYSAADELRVNASMMMEEQAATTGAAETGLRPLRR
jgi:hypothetical protein